MRVTIYLSSTDSVSQQVREIRSSHTHCLLCLVDPTGVLLYDRRSRMQHRLSWTELTELQKQITGNKLEVTGTS